MVLIMAVLDKFRAAVEEFKRIITPGWGKDDVSVEGYNPVHVINNVWQRVIALISGYDYQNTQRRFIAVDSDGRVYVNTGAPVGLPEPLISRVNVGTTAVLLASTSSTRAAVLVKNNGTANVYLGSTNAVSGTTGYPLYPNESVRLEPWSAELWAVAVSGTQDVAVMEI